jgi:anaerobic magnesium-protoporphyrin IX monomethyl ester cyclase
MNANICLAKPPIFDPSNVSYPLNIEYIAASLKRDSNNVSFVDAERIAREETAKLISDRGINKLIRRFFIKQAILMNIKIVDSFFSDKHNRLWDRICEAIVATKPDVIGFSCYTESMSSVNKIIKTLRKRFDIKIPIILGGIHPTSAPIETMNNLPEVDYLVCGEGETTIRELVAAIGGNGLKIHEIDGICYKSNGEIKQTNPRRLISNLDELPILNFDFASSFYRFYVILTSRGCPFNCKFCASKLIWGKKVRYRSPEHVVKEIINLTQKTNTQFIRFGDDTFTINKKHMRGIADLLKRKGLNNLQISIGSRIDTIDDEKIDILKSMGVFQISIGVETGSQSIANIIDKGIKIKDVVPTVKKINKAGIFTSNYFIINHPRETKVDMEATLSLMRELQKKCTNNSTLTNTGFPFPGTDWAKYCEEEGLFLKTSYYERPISRNNLGPPAVNMTDESMDTLLRMKKKLDWQEILGNFKPRIIRFLKMLVKNPKYFIQKFGNS